MAGTNEVFTRAGGDFHYRPFKMLWNISYRFQSAPYCHHSNPLPCRRQKTASHSMYHMRLGTLWQQCKLLKTSLGVTVENITLQEAKNVSAHKLIISGSIENVVFLHVTYAPWKPTRFCPFPRPKETALKDIVIWAEQLVRRLIQIGQFKWEQNSGR